MSFVFLAVALQTTQDAQMRFCKPYDLEPISWPSLLSFTYMHVSLPAGAVPHCLHMKI